MARSNPLRRKTPPAPRRPGATPRARGARRRSSCDEKRTATRALWSARRVLLPVLRSKRTKRPSSSSRGLRSGCPAGVVACRVAAGQGGRQLVLWWDVGGSWEAGRGGWMAGPRGVTSHVSRLVMAAGRYIRTRAGGRQGQLPAGPLKTSPPSTLPHTQPASPFTHVWVAALGGAIRFHGSAQK